MKNKKEVYSFQKISFGEIMIKDFKKTLVIGIGLYIILAVLTGLWIHSISFGVFIILVSLVKSYLCFRYNIEQIEIGEIVKLRFTKKGKVKTKQTHIKNLKVYKRMSFNTAKIPYLKLVFLESNDCIIQYEVGEWDEKNMNEIKKSIADYKKLINSHHS